MRSIWMPANLIQGLRDFFVVTFEAEFSQPRDLPLIAMWVHL